MKKLSRKILHYLAMHPSSNNLVCRLVQLPLMHLCKWFIYDEYRSSTVPIKQWLKRQRSVFYGFFIAVFLFLAGFMTHVNISQEILWSYRTAQYQLYQQHQLNAELQLKLATIISKRDYLRYKVFTEAGILIPDKVPTNHIQLMMEQAEKYNIPINILFRMIKQESQFDNSVVSYKGAIGYMQIMPSTFTEYGNRINIKYRTRQDNTPENNIKVGSYILSELFAYWKQYHSTDKAWELAIASYNAGLGCVQTYKAIPPYNETQKYVSFILATP